MQSAASRPPPRLLGFGQPTPLALFAARQPGPRWFDATVPIVRHSPPVRLIFQANAGDATAENHRAEATSLPPPHHFIGVPPPPIWHGMPSRLSSPLVLPEIAGRMQQQVPTALPQAPAHPPGISTRPPSRDVSRRVRVAGPGAGDGSSQSAAALTTGMSGSPLRPPA